MWVHVFIIRIPKCNVTCFQSKVLLQWCWVYKFACGIIENCCLMIWKWIEMDFFSLWFVQRIATDMYRYFCRFCYISLTLYLTHRWVVKCSTPSIIPKFHDNFAEIEMSGTVLKCEFWVCQFSKQTEKGKEVEKENKIESKFNQKNNAIFSCIVLSSPH